MGAYVDSSLLPGEQIVAEAKPDWAMFIGPVLLFLFALMLDRAGAMIAFLAVVWAAFRLLVYFTTELALTNKRVIAKSGIIRRNVVDVSNSKIEGVTYHQGIIGRIFGYGSVRFVLVGGRRPLPIKTAHLIIQ